MSNLKNVMLVDYWQFNTDKDGNFVKVSFWLEGTVYTAKIIKPIRIATLSDRYTKTKDKIAYLVSVIVKDIDNKKKKINLLCPLSLKIKDTPEPSRVSIAF